MKSELVLDVRLEVLERAARESEPALVRRHELVSITLNTAAA
jgi:hypothetical protein